jgi:hypothetical protein
VLLGLLGGRILMDVFIVIVVIVVLIIAGGGNLWYVIDIVMGRRFNITGKFSCASVC